MEKETANILGIISLIAGIIGFFAFGIILGALAMVLGGISYKESTVAKFGFWIGFIDVFLLIIFFL